jgi:hypothetical protein
MGEKPESYRDSKHCRFCISYKVTEVSYGNFRRYCEFHRFEYRYKEEPYHKICDDYMEEDEID